MLKKVLFFNDPAWNVRDTSSTLSFWHSSPPLFVCCCFLCRATAGCSSRSRVSPPGRPHRFHKPSPAQAAHGKCMMSLGNLTKGASWEELIEACLRSFGKSSPTCSEFQQVKHCCEVSTMTYWVSQHVCCSRDPSLAGVVLFQETLRLQDQTVETNSDMLCL